MAFGRVSRRHAVVARAATLEAAGATSLRVKMSGSSRNLFNSSARLIEAAPLDAHQLEVRQPLAKIITNQNGRGLVDLNVIQTLDRDSLVASRTSSLSFFFFATHLLGPFRPEQRQGIGGCNLVERRRLDDLLRDCLTRLDHFERKGAELREGAIRAANRRRTAA